MKDVLALANLTHFVVSAERALERVIIPAINWPYERGRSHLVLHSLRLEPQRKFRVVRHSYQATELFSEGRFKRVLVYCCLRLRLWLSCLRTPAACLHDYIRIRTATLVHSIPGILDRGFDQPPRRSKFVLGRMPVLCE
jgi:hypothetical protein